MSDSAAPSASPSPQSTPQPNAQPETPRHETKDWIRPDQKVSSEPRTNVARETKSAPEPRKEKPTSEKDDTEPKKKAAPVDDDPEEEWEDEKGTKFKAKRSEIRQRYARAAEIERESHKRFQQSAEQRKQADAELAQFKQALAAAGDDPWLLQRAILMKRDGLSQEQAEEKLNELAEQRLVKQMERARMSPEQIEAEQLRAENERLKTDAQKREENEKATRKAELKAKHKEQWDKTIAEAMTSANLARTRATAARVARVLADHMDPETGKSIEPALAARIAREQHHTEIGHELLETAKADLKAAIALIPPEVRKAIIAAEAQAHQEFVPQAPKQQQQSTPKPPQRTAPPTLEEARKKLGVRHY